MYIVQLAIINRSAQSFSKDEEMKLSKLERISLTNQHLILQKLYPEDADDHEKAIEILRNGYELLYDEIYQHVYADDDTMSDAECLEVWDTLSMFDSIDRSLKSLDLDHDEDKTTKFFGYDGNNEGKFLGFVEFTILKERRFSYLPIAKDKYFNSHMPARPIYGRMLAVWKALPSSSRFPMSNEDLDRVLDAANYSGD